MQATARSHVLDLFTLAIADGFVSAEELAVIHERGKELGLTVEEIDETIRNPHRVKYTPPGDLVDAITRLYDLATVLVRDGVIDPREVEVLRSFARRFGISESLLDGVVESLVEEARAGTAREQLAATLSKELAR